MVTRITDTMFRALQQEASITEAMKPLASAELASKAALASAELADVSGALDPALTTDLRLATSEPLAVDDTAELSTDVPLVSTDDATGA